MIIVLTHKPTPEDYAAESFAAFAEVVHGRVPFGHSIDLHSETLRERGYCGEHGRCLPTWQGLCPRCGGSVMTDKEMSAWCARQQWGTRCGLFDAAGVERRREATLDRKNPATKLAA
jgi:hypothetical protein